MGSVFRSILNCFKIVLFVFSSIMLFKGCKKDIPFCPPFPVPIEDSCLLTPCTGKSFGPVDHLDSLYIEYPVFNPNNGNELLLTHFDELFVYNLKTHERRLIYEGTQIFSPAWGKTGWILINTPGGVIWKMDENGNGLEQLTNGGNFYPIWNHLGDTFAYATDFNGSQLSMRMTLDAIAIDTFPVERSISYNSAWYHDKYIIIRTNNGIYCFDPNNAVNPITLDDNQSEEPYIGFGMVWAEDFVYYSKSTRDDPRITAASKDIIGIYRIGLDENKEVKLVSPCALNQYFKPTYSPQSKKLIWQRVDTEDLGNCNYYIRSNFYYMNLDGSGLEKVDIRL